MLNKKQHFLRVCKCAAACPPHTIIPVFISLVHQQKKIKKKTTKWRHLSSKNTTGHFS